MPMKGKARIQLPETTFAEASIKSSAERGSQTLRQACCQENPGSAMCVQNLDDSRGLAIRITYRISLRSSSLWEPRHPLLKVVMSLGFGEALFRFRHNLTGKPGRFRLLGNLICYRFRSSSDSDIRVSSGWVVQPFASHQWMLTTASPSNVPLHPRAGVSGLTTPLSHAQPQ